MKDHVDADCFVLFILSHGENGQICGTDGQRVSIEDVKTYFDGEHCRALLTKPKLFFIQTCQGG
jgi:Caspase domain